MPAESRDYYKLFNGWVWFESQTERRLLQGHLCEVWVGKPNSIIPGLVDEPWNKAKIHNRTGDVEAYVGYKW